MFSLALSANNIYAGRRFFRLYFNNNKFTTMLVIYPFTLQRQINFSHYSKHIYTGESILNHLSSHFIANIACKKELKLIFNLVQEETRGTVCQVCR